MNTPESKPCDCKEEVTKLTTYFQKVPQLARRAAFTGGVVGGALGSIVVQLIIWLMHRG